MILMKKVLKIIFYIIISLMVCAFCILFKKLFANDHKDNLVCFGVFFPSIFHIKIHSPFGIDFYI